MLIVQFKVPVAILVASIHLPLLSQEVPYGIHEYSPENNIVCTDVVHKEIEFRENNR